MNRAHEDVSKEQLIADFKVVVADAEALVRATANQGGEKVAELRSKAEDSINEMKAKMYDAQAKMVDKGKQAARATDTYVHDNPWTSMGVAAGVGLLLGLLIGRR